MTPVLITIGMLALVAIVAIVISIIVEPWEDPDAHWWGE